MKKYKRKRIILCPTCKTGAESYKLDELSPICPYISCYNGVRCAYYVSIDKRKGVLSKCISEIKR